MTDLHDNSPSTTPLAHRVANTFTAVSTRLDHSLDHWRIPFFIDASDPSVPPLAAPPVFSAQHEDTGDIVVVIVDDHDTGIIEMMSTYDNHTLHSLIVHPSAIDSLENKFVTLISTVRQP